MRRRVVWLIVAAGVALAGRADAQPDLQALIDLGTQRYRAGDLAGAKEAFEAAHRRAPGDARPIYLRGQVHRDQKNLPAAEKDYRAALAIDPTLVLVRAELAALLSDLGRPREAIPQFEQVLRDKPDDFESLYNLGLARNALGEWPAAIDAYRRAIRVKPDDPDVHVNLTGALYRAGRTDEALAAAREAVRVSPGDPVTHRNLALLLSETGRCPEALAALANVPAGAAHAGVIATVRGRCPAR